MSHGTRIAFFVAACMACCTSASYANADADGYVYLAHRNFLNTRYQRLTPAQRDTPAGRRLFASVTYLSQFREQASNVNPEASEYEQIKQLLFSNRNATSASPGYGNATAIFLGGGTASGKTFTKAHLETEGFIPVHHVDIDPDLILFQLKVWNSTANATRCAALQLLDIALNYSRVMAGEAMQQSLHFVLSGTMRDPTTAAPRLTNARAAGYKSVYVAGITTGIIDATYRAVSRAIGDGRWVPLQTVVKTHVGFSLNFEVYPPLANQTRLYDNSDLSRSAPTLIYRDNAPTNITLYTAFLNKRYETFSGVTQTLSTSSEGRALLDQYQSLCRCNNETRDSSICVPSSSSTSVGTGLASGGSDTGRLISTGLNGGAGMGSKRGVWLVPVCVGIVVSLIKSMH